MRTCPSCGRLYEPPAQFCQVDGASLRIDAPSKDPYLGARILDHFRIAKVIGSGGMGVVYEAQDEALGRRVAIKILHRDLLSNKDIVARFHREAQIAHQLDHPGIVRVILFGQLPDQNLYLVLEFLEGPTLLEALERSGPFEVARAVKIIGQVGDAVGYTHARGIIHRDLKPENIILTQRDGDGEFPKVLDFGIAKTLMSATSFVTQSGLIFGTARYISPEGASGDPVDQRSDVYSLAVIAYQLLTGHTPFEAEEPVQLLMKHLHEPPPRLAKWPAGAKVPAEVGDVIMRALAKNADARHPDATAFGRALREALQRSGITAPSTFGGAAGVASIVPTTSMTLGGDPLRATPVPPSRSPHDTLDRPSLDVAAVAAAPAEASGVSRVRTITRNPADAPSQPDLHARPNGAVVPPIATLPPRVEIPVVAVAPITPTAPPPASPAAMFFPTNGSDDPEATVPTALDYGELIVPGLGSRRRKPAPPADEFPDDALAVQGIERPGATRRALILVLASMLFASGAMATGAYFLRWYPSQQREDRIAELMRRANDAFHLGRLTSNADGNDVETYTDAVLAESPANSRARALRRSAAIQLQNEATALRNAGQPERAVPVLTAALRLSNDAAIRQDLETARREVESRSVTPTPPAPPRPQRPARRAPQDTEIVHPAQPAEPVGTDAGPAPSASPPAPTDEGRGASRRSNRRDAGNPNVFQVPGLPIQIASPPASPEPPREDPVTEHRGSF